MSDIHFNYYNTPAQNKQGKMSLIQQYRAQSIMKKLKYSASRLTQKQKEVIQILSDTQEELILDQKLRIESANQNIKLAMFEKDIDKTKIAIFESFVKQKDKIARQSGVRQRYTEYFKNQMGLSIFDGNFNQKINAVYGQETRPLQNKILIYGVDFLNGQKLKEYLVSRDVVNITRIDDSSASIQFSSAEEAAKFLKIQKDQVINKDNVKIQMEGENVSRAWIRLKPYEVLFYKRQLQARYVTSDQEKTFVINYMDHNQKFLNCLKTIQNYMVKQGSEQQRIYNQRMAIFSLQAQQRIRSRDKRAKNAFLMDQSKNGQRRIQRSRDNNRGNSNNYNGRGDYRNQGNRNRNSNNQGNQWRQNRSPERSYNNRRNEGTDNRGYKGSNQYSDRQKPYRSRGFNQRTSRNDQDYVLDQYFNQNDKRLNKQNKNKNKDDSSLSFYNNGRAKNDMLDNEEPRSIDLSYIIPQIKQKDKQKNSKNFNDLSLSIRQQELSIVGLNGRNKTKKRKNSSEEQQQDQNVQKQLSLSYSNFNNSKGNSKNNNHQKQEQSIQISYQIMKKKTIQQRNKQQSQIVDLSLVVEDEFLGAIKKDKPANKAKQEENDLDLSLPQDYFVQKKLASQQQNNNTHQNLPASENRWASQNQRRYSNQNSQQTGRNFDRKRRDQHQNFNKNYQNNQGNYYGNNRGRQEFRGSNRGREGYRNQNRQGSYQNFNNRYQRGGDYQPRHDRGRGRGGNYNNNNQGRQGVDRYQRQPSNLNILPKQLTESNIDY